MPPAPPSECWRGPAACRWCARAEREGTFIMRDGALHSPASGRSENPSLLLLGNPKHRRGNPTLFDEYRTYTVDWTNKELMKWAEVYGVPEKTRERRWGRTFTKWTDALGQLQRMYINADGYVESIKFPRVHRWLKGLPDEFVGALVDEAIRMLQAQGKMVGTRTTKIPTNDLDRRPNPSLLVLGNPPSAPSRIRNSWEKFHMKPFQGDAKEIPDIPGAPSDLMALGEFVDAVTDSGRRWTGGKSTRLCYEPSDKSLWVVALSGILHTGRTRGEGLRTVAYRTFGKSGKDHAVYEHKFHAPHPTVVSVHTRAAMLDGGRYIVTDWIRK